MLLVNPHGQKENCYANCDRCDMRQVDSVRWCHVVPPTSSETALYYDILSTLWVQDMKTLTPAAFAKSLRAHHQDKPPFILGIAKACEDNKDAILFATTAECDRWTTVPLDAILVVVPVGACPCRDHEHPVVALYFKDEGAPATTALAALLRDSQCEAGRPRRQGAMSAAAARTVGGQRGLGGWDLPPTVSGCTWIPIYYCWERPMPYPTIPPRPARDASVVDCGVIWAPICF